MEHLGKCSIENNQHWRWNCAKLVNFNNISMRLHFDSRYYVGLKQPNLNKEMLWSSKNSNPVILISFKNGNNMTAAECKYLKKSRQLLNAPPHRLFNLNVLSSLSKKDWTNLSLYFGTGSLFIKENETFLISQKNRDRKTSFQLTIGSMQILFVNLCNNNMKIIILPKCV